MLDFLRKEFDILVLRLDPPFCIWCYLRNHNSLFALPCRHTRVPGQIDLKKIHPRCLRINPVAPPTRNKISITHAGRHAIQNSYNLYAQLGEFTLFYGRNPEGTAIFNRIAHEFQATVSFSYIFLINYHVIQPISIDLNGY